MTRRLLIALVGALAVLATLLPLRAQSVSDAEAAEFQRIITSQLNAFSADDGATAYGFAAPNIQRLFPTPEVFMSMVQKGYAPVYRRQSYAFGRIGTEMGGQPTQHVTIIDANGKAWTALYAMQRQPDGSWKISGCSLVEAPAADA
ncbi:DUF4864 domain-containing protein [Taklimakanibacter albus]|uniref:DUF4864 domain-containing protein n=1 Tax=Taklimakanibacter albus TaxID=2800327 RepID=A0ACC5QXN9_9HYPH|nr:DUF4864 domain-containing protein [Aestuariivirga sp. YIM B02566]MBK1865160.1 DUF4864 domain-containing protein [Aestuariivirga sp. YIM B02566]